MAVTNPDYEVFLGWEFKAREAVEKRYPKLTLIKEAQEEWALKKRHRQYATALEALRDSLRNAEHRDKEIYIIRKKRGRDGPTVLGAQRTRQRTLVAARQAWRSVRRNLKPFILEQAEQDAEGRSVANERSQKYSTQLVDLAAHKISQYEDDIDQCRTVREALGSALSLTNAADDSDSEETESDASDEREGRSSDDGAEGSNADSDSKDDESGVEDQDVDQDEVIDEEDEVKSEEGERKGGPGDDDPSGSEDSSDEDSSDDGESSDDVSDDVNSSDDDPGNESESERTESEVGKDKEDESSEDEPGGPKSPESRSRRGEPDASGQTVKDSRRVAGKLGGVRGPKTSRKRKSSDDDDSDKGPSTKRQSRIESQQRQSTSAGAGASEPSGEDTPSSDEDTPSEPLSDESSEGDEQRLSRGALLNRWNALQKLAQETRKDNVKWSMDFATHRHNAEVILQSEGWAIFPDNFTEGTDLRKLLDELGAKIADAQKKMAHRRDRRKRHPSKMPGLTYKIGFGGPCGEPPVAGDFLFYSEAGKGSFGYTSIWIRHDEDGNIVERVVVKDLRPREDEWNSDQAFYGEGRDRTPREAYMHELASSQDPDAFYIVRIRGKTVFWKKHLLRIYMEYCQHGDFFDAWTRHLETVEGEELSDRFLCAPALWALFESLARAAHIMTFGTLPGGEEPTGWERMIHRDIKPENVFLSEPSETRWPGLPLMKLGDFGMAALANETWSQARGLGTRHFMPPEIRKYVRQPAEGRISSPADVWSIGMVMLDLMSGVREDIEYEYTLDMDESRLPRIDEMGQNFYPKALVKLVHGCIRRLPDDRIGIKELCNRIDSEVKELCKAKLSKEDKARFQFDI